MIQVAPFQVAMQDLKGVRSFITDPPYNLGFAYGEVDDDQDPDDYAAMIHDFVAMTHEAAADDAHLFVIHYPEHFAQHWPIYTENGWRFHQWLTWAYTGHTPEPRTTRLRRSRRAILWLQKGDPAVYVDAILRPYRNPNDRRIKAAIKEGSGGARATDVLHVEQVKKGSREHRGYSNQIPQALLHDLVKLSTIPGEMVADPFSGTGSTARAALALDRQAWGCDANPAVQQFWSDLETRQRLLVQPSLEES